MSGRAAGPDADDELEPETGHFRLSIRVRGESLDPEEVTRLLGVTPTLTARKGDVQRHRDVTMVQRSGLWVYRHDAERVLGWDLDAAIRALLARVPASAEVWRSLGARHMVDVFCGLFMRADNQSLVLAAPTLALLAERGLSLGFDVYGPPPDR